MDVKMGLDVGQALGCLLGLGKVVGSTSTKIHILMENSTDA